MDRRNPNFAPLVSRRALVGGALGAGVLAALSGCSAPGSSADGSAADESFGVAILRPKSIDPFLASDEAGLQIVRQVFEPLTGFDYETGELVGRAAQRFEVSDDALTITFYLRNRMFHSGEPVTAASFKHAWERLLNPSSAASAAYGVSPHAYLLALVAGAAELRAGEADGLSGVSCPDDRTLVVTLTEPYADFPYVAAHLALSPVPEAAEADVAAFGSAPVGNGPFMLDGSWGKNSAAIKLKRYDDYAGTVPAIERVRFPFESDTASGFQDFLTGAVDVASCPVDELEGAGARYGRAVDGLVAGPGEHLVYAADLATSYLVCNTAVAPCNNADFRRALSLAFDRTGLCERIYREMHLAADSIVPPVVPGYREGAWVYTAHDPARAEELLDGLYPLLDSDERAVAVSIIYAARGGSESAMEELAEQLKAVGMPCEVEGLEYDVFYDRLAAGDFTLARLDVQTEEPTLESILFPLFHTRSLGGANVSGYTNEEASALMTEARAIKDAGHRMALLQQAEDLIAEDMPVIPLTYPAHAVATSNRVEALVVEPTGALDLAGAVLAED